MTTSYKGRCFLCDRPFDGEPVRRRLVLYREIGAGVFTTCGYTRYMCEECAERSCGAVDGLRGGAE